MTRRALSLLVAACMASVPAIGAELKKNVWLAPLSTLNPDSSKGAGDYMELFEPNADWGKLSKQVSVFKLYPYFVSRVSKDDLSTIVSDLQRRGVALALEARVLSRTKACGRQPGDGGQNTIHLLQRIASVGGKVQYLAMDEPLKHGRHGPEECRAPIDAIATDASANIKQFKTIFPKLRVGDIEPVGFWPKASDLLTDTNSWIDAFQRNTGTPLAFFHADIGWKTKWEGVFNNIYHLVKKHGIPFGIIYNGESLASSGREWSRQAIGHATTITCKLNIVPDEIILQSWEEYPKKTLPSNDSTTLTGIGNVILQTGC